MIKNWLWIFFILIVIFLPSFGRSEMLTPGKKEFIIQSEGRAAIVKNDTARAREEAVRRALETAVAQTAAGIVPERIHDAKFQAVKNVLIGKVDHYVTTYRIADETALRDEYRVDVQVVVAVDPVRETLLQAGLLHEPAEKTRYDVLVHLKGVKKNSDFTRLKDFLQSRSKMVKSMYPCGLEQGQIQCELVISGDVQQLADDFEKTGKYTVNLEKRNQAMVIILQPKEEVK